MHGSTRHPQCGATSQNFGQISGEYGQKSRNFVQNTITKGNSTQNAESTEMLLENTPQDTRNAPQKKRNAPQNKRNRDYRMLPSSDLSNEDSLSDSDDVVEISAWEQPSAPKKMTHNEKMDKINKKIC